MLTFTNSRSFCYSLITTSLSFSHVCISFLPLLSFRKGCVKFHSVTVNSLQSMCIPSTRMMTTMRLSSHLWGAPMAWPRLSTPGSPPHLPQPNSLQRRWRPTTYPVSATPRLTAFWLPMLSTDHQHRPPEMCPAQLVLLPPAEVAALAA